MKRVQVGKEHYFQSYDSLIRFISYYYQIDLVHRLQPTSILEIGIGNRTVSTYLRNNHYKVTTCDFDRRLLPDVNADIRAVPFCNDGFDVVLACEILEHIPWDQIPEVLLELRRITSSHLIISVPFCSKTFEIVIKPPFIHRFLKTPFIDIFLRLPCFYQKDVFDGQHYWEMGRKGRSIQTIRRTLHQHFEILREGRPILDPYHYFFVLKKN